jgi:hypothetical protein
MNKSRKLKPGKGKLIKEEPSWRFHWCFVGFTSCYFLSWAIPGFLFFYYLFFYFVPYVLMTENFITLFTKLDPLISLLAFPLVVVFCYILHLFIAALVIKFWWWVTEKINPSKDGVIPRNIPSKTLNLYHIRSFIVKYPKNIVTKGLFPWLFTWVFNFIGSTEYGKGTTVEEEPLGDKFVNTGKDCYVAPNASLASHLVEGIFGNIYYFKIYMGDNVTVGPEVPIGPGSKMRTNTFLFPSAATLKFTESKGGNYYFGMPMRRLFGRKLRKYLKVSKEDLKKAEELSNKYKQDEDKQEEDKQDEG